MPRACFENELEEATALFSQLQAVRSFKPHESPSVFSQQFTLVSREGEQVSMPIYDLMSWS